MDAYDELLQAFSAEKRDRFLNLFDRYMITRSARLELIKDERDTELWLEKSLLETIDFDKVDSLKGPARREELLRQTRTYMAGLRSRETDYSTFPDIRLVRPRTVGIQDTDRPLGFGRCPCPIDGEVTRCCKLTTLDAVMQCGFACSYCSVQAFYNENRIEIASDLERKLDELEIPEGVWHIGTGQASDSLLLGDDYGTLSALARFADRHPEIVLELKSKAGRNCFSKKWPSNMVFTWSLNAPTIIKKEEHLTAGLEERLENAMRCRDNGNLVGFHIHPMVYFKGWQDEYADVANAIERRFRPEEICMISAGTLIFTKENLRYIRGKGEHSRVLEMDLVPTAGKYSYPFETKLEMFSTLFSSFSEAFRNNVFTYLCLEDPELWMPVLGRSYECDRAFEADMKKCYIEKVEKLRRDDR